MASIPPGYVFDASSGYYWSSDTNMYYAPDSNAFFSEGKWFQYVDGQFVELGN